MSDERTALEKHQIATETMHSQLGYSRSTDYVDGYSCDNSAEDEDSQFDLSRILRAIFKRKLLIAAIVIFGTALVTFEMYRTKDSYRSYTIISVGKEDTSLIRSGVGRGELIIQSDEPMRTKIFLLQSALLIEDVIVDLKLSQNPQLLEPGKKTLQETYNSISDRIFLKTDPNAPPDMSDTANITEIERAPRHERDDIESWRLEPYVDLFRRRYSVETVPETRMIKVSFTHSDPVLAATVCNRLAQIFIERNFEGKSQRFREASDWLEKMTRELKTKIEKAEQSLANYIREHKNIVPQGKVSLVADKLTRLQAEVTRSETERIVKESLYEESKQGRVAQIPEAFGDPRIAALQKKHGELLALAAQLDVNYGPDNPQTIEVQQQIAAMEKQIDSFRQTMEEKLKNDYERAVRDEKAFREALDQARNESAQENQEMIQYGILQQEVDTSKSVYKSFLEKSNQANFELAQQENNLHVIQPARVPRILVAPLRKRWILAGFAFSLVLGIGLAIVLEKLDHTIQSSEDINRHVQLPALASIPTITNAAHRSLWQRITGKQKSLSKNGSAAGTEAPLEFDLSIDAAREPALAQTVALDCRSPAAEAYRMLIASLMLSVESSAAKTLLITSSQPGEGKTTTTINAAISMAQLGASVLVIDCDLRTPRVHERLSVSQNPGLTGYLSGKAKLTDVIQQSDIPGMSLLPSGPIPSNPVGMVNSRKMKEMLHRLAPQYDHILIDSPPLINLADPLILSTLVDGVILVAHVGKSDRDAVRRTRQDLSYVGANILGVVLNNIAHEDIEYHDRYSNTGS